MADITRRTLIATSAAGVIVTLTACTDDADPTGSAGSASDPTTTGSAAPQPTASASPEPETHEVATAVPASDTVVAATDGLALSRLLFETASVVVVAQRPAAPASATPAAPSATASPAAPSSPAASPSVAPSADPAPASEVATAAHAAAMLGVPLYFSSPELATELDRLQTEIVIGYPADGLEVGDREVIPGTASVEQLPSLDGLPRTPEPATVTVFTDGTATSEDVEAMLAAAGITAQVTTSGHPGETSETVAAAKANSAPVIGIGSAFGTDEALAARVEMARSAVELPGGGVTPFPGRNMIALYGHPGAPVLGMMGEQPPAEAVARTKALVAEYQAARPDVNFIGAFEIITTIASSTPTSDGTYTIESSPEKILPYIEAAEAANMYVVLDLQPGRKTFLEQARLYEDLLKRPWVGLALDPEWRLKPDQVHLRQIGQVTVDEINEVGTWLADLVRDNGLPAKSLTLHQFQPRMIIERERLDTTRDEIQYLVHVDGLGGQGAKQGTWRAILRDLPERVYLGWKNFEDEDQPMLTPAQTVTQVEPLPDFVSYQ